MSQSTIIPLNTFTLSPSSQVNHASSGSFDLIVEELVEITLPVAASYVVQVQVYFFLQEANKKRVQTNTSK
jgi:hypothetical protein